MYQPAKSDLSPEKKDSTSPRPFIEDNVPILHNQADEEVNRKRKLCLLSIMRNSPSSLYSL